MPREKYGTSYQQINQIDRYFETEKELNGYAPFFYLPMTMMKCIHIIYWQFLLNTIEE